MVERHKEGYESDVNEDEGIGEDEEEEAARDDQEFTPKDDDSDR